MNGGHQHAPTLAAPVAAMDYCHRLSPLKQNAYWRRCFFACAHCRQNRFSSSLRSRGRNRSPRRLARFENVVLDVAHGIFVSTRGPTTLDPGHGHDSHNDMRGDSLSNVCFVEWFHKKFESWRIVTKMTSHPCKYLGRYIVVIEHLVA